MTFDGAFEKGWQDLRFGVRSLRRAQVYTVLTVLTLGLSIGSSVAVFSLVNSVLLQPLPYPHASRLTALWRTEPLGGFFSGSDDLPWSPREYHTLLASTSLFENVGAFKKDTFNLTGTASPELLEGARTSAGFFPAFGSAPILGRTFTDDEDKPGMDHVAVLSEQFWRSHLSSDPNVLGRTLQLNGAPYIVVGVMGSAFTFPNQLGMPVSMEVPRETQLWVPLALPPNARGANELGVVAERKDGVTPNQVSDEMTRFERALDLEYPTEKGWGTHARSLEQQVASDARRPLLLFMTAVSVVLLIACANVAGLALNRTLARRQEIGLRQALGAKRGRLLQLFLTENLLLAFAGGITGLCLATLFLQLARQFGPPSIPHLHDTALSGRVLLFSAGLTVLTGFLFGFAPALTVRRTNLNLALKEGGLRGTQGAEVKRARNGFLIVQFAFALVLTTSAGLLVRTFMRMLQSDPGFASEHVITFELPLPTPKYSNTDRMAQVYEQVQQNLRSLPGVQQAGFSSVVPMGGATDSSVIRFPDRPSPDPNDRPSAGYSFMSPGYLSTVHASFLQGRDFNDTDTLKSLPVTIINSAMARKYWPGVDPLGKQVGLPITHLPARTVVGVVEDIKHSSLREATTPEMWVPYSQNEIKVWPSMQTMQFAVRSASDPSALSASIRMAVHSADPELPVAKLATLSDMVSDSLLQDRFALYLIAALGLFALLLASVGTYGVLSYSILQSTREIGVRLALGAKPATIFRMVLRQGTQTAAYGMTLGLVGSIASTHLMTRFLYGVRPNDPLTLSCVVLLMLTVVLLACALPARRAMRTNIIQALRYE